MPRHTDRNYRALAETQNRVNWVDEDPRQIGALAAACVIDFRAAADRSQQRYLATRRARLVDAINVVVEYPNLFWSHEYFRYASRSVFSTADAVVQVRRAVAKLERVIAKRRWSAGPITHQKLEELREALVFARYFRRFGQRAWSRKYGGAGVSHA